MSELTLEENIMSVITAHNVAQARELLNSGKYKEVALDFDVATDDFFKIATEYVDQGAKIKKAGDRFIIKLKSAAIPPVE